MTLLVLILVVLSIYAGRVIDLMVVQGPTLAADGQKQRLRAYPLPADRGPIHDSTGALLAVTVEARNLTADQTLISDPAAAAARLAPMIDADPVALQRTLTGTDRFVYIAKGLTPQQWRAIQALKIRGLFSERTTARTYPGGQLAANVLGFVNAEGVGSGGVEMQLDDRLAGVDGSRMFETGAQGVPIPTAERVLRPPTPGQGVQLTINRDLQYVAQRAIADQVADAAADTGSVTVLEARTGRILAMATAPVFNPNDYTAADPAAMGNRITSDVYEPGSTGKVITAAAVVEEGAATPESRMVVPPVLIRKGSRTNDSEAHGTLKLTLNGVLAESSNIGTVLFADEVGGDTLYQYMRKFGIAEPTGLGFPGESAGLLPSPDRWWASTFPALAYGQGYSVTSLQMANVFATIANGGVRLTPRLIDGYTNPDGTFEPSPTTPGVRVVSEATATTVTRMLENVVTQGTGKPAAIPGYRVAGKTSTAERAVEGGYAGYNSSFIGFVPADDPAIVVQVVVENPRNGRYGSVLAAPVFKAVATYALQTLAVPPSGTTSPRIPLTW